MKTLFLFLFCSFISLQIMGQPEHKVSIYAKMQGNYILYDQAMGNGWGPGTGIKIDVNLESGLRPFLDFNCDIYPTNDVQTYIDGIEMEMKKTVPTIFAGISYPIFRNFYLSLEAGPAFINSDIYMGIKPCFFYFLDKKQRMSVVLSLTHIFEADHSHDGPFGYAGLGLNFRVF
jgi:hypothetical protein